MLEKKNKEKKKKEIDPEKGYYEAVGRRKRSVARVRIYTSGKSDSAKEGNLIINDKPYKEYFPTIDLQKKVEAPLARLKSLGRFRGTIKVKGGGVKGQAEAIRHGIARALILFDSNFRKKLKKAGYLTRDPRRKERKKFGLKKARKRPQWSKR
ncbi:MAG: 30S ribosomal protein S9 [Candidatus Portnoybacteria bacterium]|nr:30S ribosomal protein S9 [Candidatus Portnoybacteria bacterium]